MPTGRKRNPKKCTSESSQLQSKKKPRTHQSYNSAITNYNRLADSNEEVPKYSELTRDVLVAYGVEKLFRQYAQYLLDNVETHNSCMTYFSSFRTKLEKDFPNLPCFAKELYDSDNKLPWYSSIYHDLSTQKVDTIQEEGGDVVTKPDNVGREMINESCEALLMLNTPQSVFNRFAILMLWSAVGRACELALATFNSMSFDLRELEFNWKQNKTHAESPMRFPKDRHNMGTCPFHAMGCYLITYKGCFSITGQANAGVRWLFPQFQNWRDGAIATNLTNVLRDLKKKNLAPSLPDKPCIHGLKAGAFNHMAFDSRIAHIVAVLRAGWGETDMRKQAGNQIHYVDKKKKVSQGGMSLHGYGGDLKECPPAPSLACITTVENRVKLETMKDLLFCTSNNEFLGAEGALRRVVDCMLACQFVHFEECELKCTPPQTNIITDTIIAVANSLAITREDIITWGKKIYIAWLTEVDRVAGLNVGDRDVLDKAAYTLEKVAENTSTLNKIEADVSGLVHSDRRLREELVTIKADLVALRASTTATYDLLKSITTEHNSTAIPSVPVVSTVATVASSVTNGSTESGRNPFDIMKVASSAQSHKTIFNAGVPNKMTADNFVACVDIHNIHIRSSQPFVDFKVTPQLRSKLAKIVKYLHQELPTASNDRLQILRSTRDDTGKIPIQQRDKVRQIYRDSASRLLLRLNEDMVKYHEFTGATKKAQRKIRVQDEFVGSMVTKIEKLEQHGGVCLTDPARRRFYQ